MRILLIGLVALLFGLPISASAKNELAGEYDYFVLSLSWSPNWCAIEGDAKRSPQCADDTGHGWIMHGLWPQFHRGYPSFCRTVERPPSRGMTNAMADIMGTGGLAWHQWNKHGTCTGLSAQDYYALSRRAYATVTRPDIFRKLDRSVKLPASVVEDAFLKANPTFEPDGITITCRNGHIQEARLCLSRDLMPVPCGQDVVRDCTLKDAVFDPLR
ncbi:MAG: ribonuclease T2 family protein [Sulfitobacter sp.]